MFDNDTFKQRYDGDDAALLTLFREWRAGMQDIEGQRPAEETDDQFNAANDAVFDIARQIYDTPAAGPVGLAIKAFMLAFEVCIDDVDRPRSDEPASLGKFDLAQNHYGAGDTLYLCNHALKGLAGDIARFVPELAPLVAGVVQSPTTHRWRRRGFSFCPSGVRLIAARLAHFGVSRSSA